MGPVLTLFGRDMRPYADTADVDLDLAYGEGENDWTLRTSATPVVGGFVGVLGTPYGGPVDGVTVARSDGVRTATWRGRTWTGLLASHVLEPDPGADHLVVSGDAHHVIAALVGRMGLGGVFHAPGAASGLEVPRTELPRYCDGYDGVGRALAAAGAVLRVVTGGDGVTLRAERLRAPDEVVADGTDYSVGTDGACVNHLVALGKGEGAQRLVAHWYADRAGNVSKVQSLFGPDEVAQVYDRSNADAGQLDADARERLEGLQVAATCSVGPGGAAADVGDVVTARDEGYGIVASATVAKVICKIRDGQMCVECETGEGARVARAAGMRGW